MPKQTDTIRQMSQGRSFVPVIASRPRRLRTGAALGALALLLAGCGSSPEPISQPLDAGQPAQPGPGQHLADNGDHEHKLPQVGPAALAGGNVFANVPNPAPMSAAPPAGAAGQANDDPTQPMGADPLMDAGGFDPAPQGEGEVNHSVPSGDTATVGSAHS